jgi:TRAP-type C4-dicarboxylate transport system permease small subunit
MIRDRIKRGKEIRHTLYAGLFFLSGVVLVTLMLLTVADVAGRYIFNHPIRGNIEISMQMMAYVTLPGLAYTLIKGIHVRVSLVLERLPQKVRIEAEVLADIMGLFLCGLLTWGSWVQFWDSWIVWEFMPAAVRIPWWPAKLVMPVGFCLMAVEFGTSFFGHLVQLRRKG